MLAQGLPVERLREYLLALAPAARALLIAELERGLLRGDNMAGAELVLAELRRCMRELGQRAPRIGNPARLFFQPLEPFLVDDALNHQHRGRIARAALDPLWQWIHIVAPTEAKSYCEQVEQALLAGDAEAAAQLARAFQARAAERLQEALAAAESDDKARRRLAVQMGTPRALEDVRTLVDVLKARSTLDQLAGQLPGHIQSLAGAQLDSVKALLDPLLARNPGVFLYALIMVMGRLAAPWQLIRLATHAAGSDVVARIAETPYAQAVAIVLAEIERVAAELAADLKSGRGIAVSALLKHVHDAVRGVRTEIDLSADTPWSRQLAAILTRISQALTAVIELIPGRVRRLVRPSKEAAGARLSAEDVDETEALVGFLVACRAYASELAVNEITLRAYSELQQYLDTGTQALLDALRLARADERAFRQSQMDAAVRFCAHIFGREYADLLAKAAEVACHSPDGERKPAKA